MFLQVYFCKQGGRAEDGSSQKYIDYFIQSVNLCLSRAKISPHVRESKTGSEVLDSRFGSLVGSELLELYSGFESPGFRILQGKNFPDSKIQIPLLKRGRGRAEVRREWAGIRSILNNEAKKV